MNLFFFEEVGFVDATVNCSVQTLCTNKRPLASNCNVHCEPPYIGAVLTVAYSMLLFYFYMVQSVSSQYYENGKL